MQQEPPVVGDLRVGAVEDPTLLPESIPEPARLSPPQGAEAREDDYGGDAPESRPALIRSRTSASYSSSSSETSTG